MELSQLNTFLIVAKTLNFTRASEILNITQPAVSHQIKLLENEIGQDLFVRGKNEIHLTEAGKILFGYAKKSLDIIDEAKAKLDDVKIEKPILLRIAAVSNSMRNIFGEVQKEIKKKYKNFNLLFIATNNGDEALEKVINREADIAFVRDGISVKDVIQIPYVSTRIVFVAGINHPISQKKSISLCDLQNEEWILFEKNNGYRIIADYYFEKMNFHPANTLETNDGMFLVEMLKNGDKISFLPLPNVGKTPDLQVLDVVAPKCKIQMNAAFHKAREKDFYYEFLESVFNVKLFGFTRLFKKKSIDC